MADPSIERFRKVVAAACAQLEARRQEVNDLNVFPVADGDTGDNMVQTLRAVMSGARPPQRPDGRRHRARRDRAGGRPRGAARRARQQRRDPLAGRARRGRGAVQPARASWSTRCSCRPRWRAPPTPPTASVRDPAEGTMITVVREMAHRVATELAHMSKPRLDADATDEEQDAVLAEVLEQALRGGPGVGRARARAAAGAARARRRRRRRLRRDAAGGGRARRPARRARGAPRGRAPGGDLAPHGLQHEASRVPLLHELRRARRATCRRAAPRSRRSRSWATPCWSSATARRCACTSTRTSPSARSRVFDRRRDGRAARRRRHARAGGAARRAPRRGRSTGSPLAATTLRRRRGRRGRGHAAPLRAARRARGRGRLDASTRAPSRSSPASTRSPRRRGGRAAEQRAT